MCSALDVCSPLARTLSIRIAGLGQPSEPSRGNMSGNSREFLKGHCSPNNIIICGASHLHLYLGMEAKLLLLAELYRTLRSIDLRVVDFKVPCLVINAHLGLHTNIRLLIFVHICIRTNIRQDTNKNPIIPACSYYS